MGKIIEKPHLIFGEIMHQRFFPNKNYFKYKSVYVASPLSQIKKMCNAIFSINRFNMFSLNTKNFGYRNLSEMHRKIYQMLEKYNIKDLSEIYLVTHPTLLGYVFNPISFWLCYCKNNKLIAVLNEVRNTCGQKHYYLCYKTGFKHIKSTDWLKADKEFYVSPFMKTEGEYKFRFDIKKNHMNFYINYIVDSKIKLSTYLKCRLCEFRVSSLFLAFLKMPFFTIKTTVLIHVQALKLYLKSIKHYKCPKKNQKNITLGKDAK